MLINFYILILESVDKPIKFLDALTPVTNKVIFLVHDKYKTIMLIFKVFFEQTILWLIYHADHWLFKTFLTLNIKWQDSKIFFYFSLNTSKNDFSNLRTLEPCSLFIPETHPGPLLRPCSRMSSITLLLLIL